MADQMMFNAPIPGESLTTSVDNPAPYEQPAAHSDVEEASRELFLELTEPGKMEPILDLMRRDVPLEEIAQVSLFRGFQQGKWNPDLMLLMVEPTIYLLLFLADYADIDPVMYPEDDMEMSPEDEAASFRQAMDVSAKKGREAAGLTPDQMPAPEGVPSDIAQLAKERLGEKK